MTPISLVYRIRQLKEHDAQGNNSLLLSAKDKELIDAGDWMRAGGECVCTCGYKYSQHDPVNGALWMTRLCNGKLVKL